MAMCAARVSCVLRAPRRGEKAEEDRGVRGCQGGPRWKGGKKKKKKKWGAGWAWRRRWAGAEKKRARMKRKLCLLLLNKMQRTKRIKEKSCDFQN